MKGYLETFVKAECIGCEACAQICNSKAITMQTDDEGFRYPSVDSAKCTNCNLCKKVCPVSTPVQKNAQASFVFGGSITDDRIINESTSGGAFSAIASQWAKEGNYVIFGAETQGLVVKHCYITDISDLRRLRKSKYSQSIIGNSYKETKQFLKEGKRVLFSGTPCHIAGLKNYLGKVDTSNLLTVEVICEGVPSPLYISKLSAHFEKKHGSPLEKLDYRYKPTKGVTSLGSRMKWDFEVMLASLRSQKCIQVDRWFNPFWSIWLQHLMSRPSCYECPFATKERVADISLGDLWGVHLYCPELYNKNKGASVVFCNTEYGKLVVTKAATQMKGHELRLEDALRYQGPMRKCIDKNPKRSEFMADLVNQQIDYTTLTKKWAVKPSLRLLFAKYVYGNRQKVFMWNLRNIKR